MKIEVGKTAPIIDEEDQLLASVWKSKGVEQLAGKTGFFPFSSSFLAGKNPGDPGDPEDPKNRPQLSDIELVGFEEYEDVSKMQKYRARFKVYNSSGESLEKFAVALSLSDSEGGSN